MSIQFGNNLKVFVTINTNSLGKVNSTGFTSANTRELSIIKDSLSATQQKTFEYVSNNNSIDSGTRLESVAGAGLSLGDLSFSIYLNSSASGPYDSWLWNSLINEASYPGENWTLNSGNLSLALARQSTQTQVAGLIVISNNTTYIFDGLRVKNSSISFDLNNLVQTNWNFNFEEVRLVNNVVLDQVPVIVSTEYESVNLPEVASNTYATWSVIDGSNGLIEGLGSNGTRLVARVQNGFNPTRLFYSDNRGLTWTQATVPGLSTLGAPFSGANGVWILPRGNSSLQAIRSADNGVTWSNVTIPNLGAQLGAYGNGIYVLAGQNNVVGRSIDNGITWTSYPLNARSDYYSDILYAQDRFVVVRNNSYADYSLDGITWTNSTAAVVSGDTDYSSVVLLLLGNGTNASTTFTDSATTPKTVTPSGNTQLTTTNPKYDTTCMLFDGSGDFLTVPTSTDFDLGNTYTIEFWVNPVALSGGILHRGFYTATGGGIWAGLTFSIRFISGGIRFYFYATTNANEQFIDGPAMSTNTWTHVAMVRNGTNGAVYINGVLGGSISGLNTSATSTQTLRIGRWDFSVGNEDFNGRLDDIRITKGVARYSSNFIPPTDTLPSFQSSVQDPNYHNVVLSLHGNGTNGSTTITDSSPSPKTATAVGNAQVSTVQSKFGGASLLFDGTGDSITIPTSTDFDLGNTYTIEFWIRPNSLSSNFGVIHRAYFNNNTSTWLGNFSIRWIGTSLGMRFYFYGTVTSDIQSLDAPPGDFAVNTWTHVAMVRSESTGSVYVNGVLKATRSDLNTAPVNTQPLRIGNWDGFNISAAFDEFYNGYLDDIRITKGVARYTSAFTPHVLPHPDNGVAAGQIQSGTKKLAFGNGVIVGIIIDNPSLISSYVYSLDRGQTWTTANMPVAANWKSVAFGVDRFLVLARGNFGPKIALQSFDGITWTSVASPIEATVSPYTQYVFPSFVNVHDGSSAPHKVQTWTNYRLKTLPPPTNPTITDQYFSGDLAGTIPKLKLLDYKVCPARTMLVTVYNANNLKLGSLAVTNLQLNIANNLVYLEDKNIDRSKLGYKYVESGNLVVEGSFGFYSRKTGSYANTLLNDLLNNLTSSDINTSYTLVIELLVNNTTKLCDIKLTNCVASLSTEFSTALTNTLTFKALAGSTELNSFIKFYT